MRRLTCIVALGAVAAAVAGCADPYAQRSAYSPGYNYASGYNYPSGYNNYPSGYGYPPNTSYPGGSYYPARYGYGSSNGDYGRTYGGTRSSPQIMVNFP